MAVPANQRQVFETRLPNLHRFGKRNEVVALDQSVAVKSVADTWIQVADLAPKGSGGVPCSILLLYLLEPRLIEPIRAELAELRSELADVQLVRKGEGNPAEGLAAACHHLKASIRRLERQREEGELAIEQARRAAARSHAA